MSARQPLVAIDLDDSLNLLHLGLASCLAARGHGLPVEQWNQYNIHELVGMSVPAFQQMIIEEQLLERALPHPGARDAVSLLHAAGCEVEVWTARGFHPDAQGVSERWLEQHGLEGVRVRVLPYGVSKASLLSEAALKARLVGFIDDHAGHVEDMAKVIGERAYLIDQTWNRQARNAGLRVRSVYDAARLIVGSLAGTLAQIRLTAELA